MRWLEGWGIIFPSVGIALVSAWLSLPQGAMPDYLPLPRLPRTELSTARRELDEQGARAHERPLDYEVRAVGESIRQLGRLAYAGESVSGERRERIRELVRTARARRGDEQLVQLRAIQTRMFQTALGSWQSKGNADDDLVELGGDFLAVAARFGWIEGAAVCRDDAQNRGRVCSLTLDDDERAALFLTRWTDLIGASEDQRLRLAPVWKLLALRARLRLPLAQLDERDLRLVDRVKVLDPTYPDLLSKGLIYVRLSDRERAIHAFRSHLHARPDGPFALRARNHLVYAIDKMGGDGS